MPSIQKRSKYPSTENINSKGNKKISYNKTTLDNGLRIITESVQSVESFALGMFVNAGSREDFQSYNGIAHFTEHVLFKRTKKRNALQLAKEFESIGAYYNAFTSKETTCYYVRALKNHFTKTLELLSDIVLNPVFAEKDIASEREVIVEEIGNIEDEPEELIFDYGDKLIFGNHTLSNPILGTKNSISKIDSDRLIEFHNKFYSPGNLVVVAAGNLNHNDVVKECRQLFSQTSNTKQFNSRLYPNETLTLRQEISKKYQQSHVLIGRRVPGFDSDEKFPLAAISMLFGEGMSSRLYQELREKQSLAYNISSTYVSFTDCGEFYVYGSTDPQKLDKLDKNIFNEIEKLLSDRISKSEIDRAKEQLKTNTIIDLESMSARIQMLARNELYASSYRNIQSILDEIDSINPKQIRDIAEKYFNPADWNVILFNS